MIQLYRVPKYVTCMKYEYRNFGNLSAGLTTTTNMQTLLLN